MKNKKQILVLAPHTDDGEFGCGGTITKLIEDGHNVFYAAFSCCEESVPDGFDKNILEKELKDATAILGIPSSNLIVFRFPVRKFPENRQLILEEMVKMQKNIQPDMVLLPSLTDTHQDHQTISEEGFRAFKRTTLFGYEVPWNNLTFDTTCFFPLEDQHVKQKVTALDCYKSQAFRSYANSEFIYSLARVRGTQIGKPFAEVFQTIRYVHS